MAGEGHREIYSADIGVDCSLSFSRTRRSSRGNLLSYYGLP